MQLEGTAINSSPVKAVFMTMHGAEAKDFSILMTQFLTIDEVQGSYVWMDCNQDEVYEKDYRIGFNGQEKDNELKGIGNSLDFGARMYDSRLGRWLSLDPLQAKYPSLSPYNFVANCPVYFVDRDGKKIYIFYTDEKGNNTYYEYGSKIAVPNNSFVQQTIASLDYIKQVDPTTQKVVSGLTNTPKVLNIFESKEGAFNMAAEIPLKELNGNLIPPRTPINLKNVMADEANLPFNPYAALSDNSGNESISPATAMSHELSHVYSAFTSILGYLNTLGTSEPNFHNYQEKNATEFEHRVAGYGGEWKRTDHRNGQEIITMSPTSNRPVITNESQLGQGEEILLK